MNFSSAAAPRLENARTNLLWFHERFGKPQVYALLLLLAFLGQCFWLAAHTPVTNAEMAYVSPGHEAEATPVVAPQSHPPIVTLLANLPPAVSPGNEDTPLGRMALRWPFIFVGALLGASLWYVSRRLYGNAGGYFALALYIFSPPMVLRWSMVSPDVLAAWGVFGCVFTGIAVAHTLYAPREVVLWNWRRILLLGISIGLGASAVFSTVIAVPMALVFMLYLVPHRRGAALAILGTACAVACAILFAAYSFHPSQIAAAAHASNPLRFTPVFFSRGVANALFGGFLLRNGPAFLSILVISLATYAVWPRTRFFGTTAPLLVAVAFTILAVSMAHQDVMTYLWIALPFLMVFIAGVCADLLEVRNKFSGLLLGLLLAILASHALFSLTALWRLHGA